MNSTVYLKLRGRETYYSNDITAFVVSGATQNKPSKLGKNEIVVKLKLEVPKEAFEPFEPEAVVTIPADLTERGPIEVVATEVQDDDE